MVGVTPLVCREVRPFSDVNLTTVFNVTSLQRYPVLCLYLMDAFTVTLVIVVNNYSFDSN